MNRRLKRTLPYLQLLKLTTSKDVEKKRMLKSFPAFVIDDIVEILYNILTGNVNLPRNAKQVLELKKKTLNNFYKVARNPKKRKQLLLRQKCGFIGTLIPILASAVGGLVGSAL